MSVRSFLTVSVLIFCLILLGCSGSEYRFGNSPREQSLSGQWLFQATSNVTTQQFQGTATLGQVNLGINGSMGTMFFGSCAPTSTVSGLLSGALVPGAVQPGPPVSVALQLQGNVSAGGTQEVDLTGSAATDANSMSGTYTVPIGPCASMSDAGVWTAYKQ